MRCLGDWGLPVTGEEDALGSWTPASGPAKVGAARPLPSPVLCPSLHRKPQVHGHRGRGGIGRPFCPVLSGAHRRPLLRLPGPPRPLRLIAALRPAALPFLLCPSAPGPSSSLRVPSGLLTAPVGARGHTHTTAHSTHYAMLHTLHTHTRHTLHTHPF